MSAPTFPTLWIAFGQFDPVIVAPVVVLEETKDRYRVESGFHTYHRDWLWKDDPWLFEDRKGALTKAIDENRSRLKETTRKVDSLVGALNNLEYELSAEPTPESKGVREQGE